MATAEWNGAVIATSAKYEIVEGNLYFPRDSVDDRYLLASDTHTVCGWKGTASYHHVKVGERQLDDAAWYYPEPKAAASQIKGYVAFWRGVKVTP